MYSRDEVLLHVDNVVKRYGNKEVLSGVNAVVRDLHCSDAGRTVGQVAAFLGPSGVGKTQLLHIIAGLEDPTSGQVLLDVEQHPVQRGMVGMVFQRYPVWNNRTVISNAVLAGELAGMHNKQSIDNAKKYLEAFELHHDADKYPAELSGGMQQRLAVIRQLQNMDGPCAHPTRVMLMDEPFAALDFKNTKRVCAMVRSVADLNDDTTIIVVTHDLRSALAVADQVWIMGRERDLSGYPVSGGKIVRDIDLAQMGLTWNPDVYHMKEFQELEAEISAMYDCL